MKNTITSLLIIILTGCTYGSANVKKDYTRHEIYHFDINYQAVYRKMSIKVSECFTSSYLNAQTNLYTDIEMGEMVFGNEFGTFLVIEMKPVDKSSSTVDVYVGASTWNSSPEKVKGWIDGTRNEC